jgi:hypothetical protein
MKFKKGDTIISKHDGRYRMRITDIEGDIYIGEGLHNSMLYRHNGRYTRRLEDGFEVLWNGIEIFMECL